MFEQSLRNILQELERVSTADRDELFKSLIQKKLNMSYETYMNNIKINYDYLLIRDNLKVLKNISKERKKSKQHEEHNDREIVKTDNSASE